MSKTNENKSKSDIQITKEVFRVKYNPPKSPKSHPMQNEICHMHHMLQMLKSQFPSILSYATQICHMPSEAQSCSEYSRILSYAPVDFVICVRKTETQTETENQVIYHLYIF